MLSNKIKLVTWLPRQITLGYCDRSEIGGKHVFEHLTPFQAWESTSHLGVNQISWLSDVFLEAEASPRGVKSAASASPGCSDASPRSCHGLNAMTSKLRYDIIIHTFYSFIFFIYLFKLRPLRQNFICV